MHLQTYIIVIYETNKNKNIINRNSVLPLFVREYIKKNNNKNKRKKNLKSKSIYFGNFVREKRRKCVC